MMDWQPIETAPRGTAVLVAAREWISILALFQVYGRTIQHPDNPTSDGQGREAAWEWRDNSGDGGQDYRPTHWMPLPELPQNETLTPTASLRCRRTVQGTFSMSAPNGVDFREVLVLQQRFQTPGGRDVWRDVPVVDVPEGSTT